MWQELQSNFPQYIDRMFEENNNYLEKIRYHQLKTEIAELEASMQKELDELPEAEKDKLVEITWRDRNPLISNRVEIVD